MNKKRVGRPLKYKALIEALDDDTLYTAATIADHGWQNGLFDPFFAKGNVTFDRLRMRIRHTLARFSHNHDFPKNGDGYFEMPGQQPQRGWYGKRWKQAAGLLD